MKLRSSKMIVCGSAAMTGLLLMSFAPSVTADAGTTQKQQQSTFQSSESITASYTENTQTVALPAYENTSQEGIFEGKAVAIADPYVEVLASPDAEGEVVGRLDNNDMATVLEVGKTWTKVQSGSLVGYVSTANLCFDEEAEQIANMNGGVKVSITADSANVYATGSSDAVLTTAAAGESFTATGTYGNYIRVSLEDGSSAYVNEADASVDYGFGTGETNEELAAQAAAEEAAAEAAQAAAAQAAAEAQAAADAAAAAKSASASASTGSSQAASQDDVYLLACIIHWEACGEPYEGQVAVGNVVLNRLNSGYYGSSIASVIYAPGQFSGVTDGSGNPSAAFQARLASGPSASCMAAAEDALAGVSYAGGYSYFRTVSGANVASYSSYMVIGGHVFYNY